MGQSWPNPEEALSLYLRLGGSDPVAQSDFVAAFLDPLVAFLRADSPHADDHARLTAAEDAVLSVIHNPPLYKSDEMTLPAFLRMAAKRDLLNLLAKENRRHRRREYHDSVELAAGDGNSDRDEADDLPSFDEPILAAVIAGFTDVERRVFELMRAGERRTEVFAPVLGVQHLPPEEQTREVKRVKERIFKRLRRAGGSRE
jgi:DNA-directed RNA polymerase specialized sigma24 family protein